MGSPSRRSFLTRLSTLAGLSIAALLSIPGAAYVLDPLLRKNRNASKWRKVATVDVLNETPLSLPVWGQLHDAWTKSDLSRLGTVWLRRTDKGRVHALSAECPHLGCQISFDSKKKLYACPCHESDFDLSGNALSGPAPRPMDELEARIVDGDVEVRFKRFRLQTTEKIELS